jgi:hypothetical protein
VVPQGCQKEPNPIFVENCLALLTWATPCSAFKHLLALLWQDEKIIAR